MAVSTGTAISVSKTLPAGVVTTYANVSLYVLFNGVTKRYNATVVNSTATVAGSISVASLTLADIGTHVCTFSTESAADLDTNGIVITPLFVTNISAVAMQTAITF